MNGDSFMYNIKEMGTKLFFNRSLGVPLSSQRVLYDLFYKIMDKMVEQAIEKKSFSVGITGNTFQTCYELA